MPLAPTHTQLAPPAPPGGAAARRLSRPLGARTLASAAAAPAAAKALTEADMPKSAHGFDLVRHQFVREYDSHVCLYRHKKTGWWGGEGGSGRAGPGWAVPAACRRLGGARGWAVPAAGRCLGGAWSARGARRSRLQRGANRGSAIRGLRAAGGRPAAPALVARGRRASAASAEEASIAANAAAVDRV
jgi:hypothetical protein